MKSNHSVPTVEIVINSTQISFNCPQLNNYLAHKKTISLASGTAPKQKQKGECGCGYATSAKHGYGYLYLLDRHQHRVDLFMSTAFHLLKRIGLSNQRAIEILPRMQARTYAFAEDIGRDQTGYWTYIVDGLVGASVSGDGLAPINIHGPGVWFGEGNLFTENGFQLDYTCLTVTTTLRMPIADARNAFDHEVGFARYVARLFALRSQQQTEMLALMRIGGPTLRIVIGLGLFAEAFKGSPSRAPSGIINRQEQDTLIIPVKQAVLASMCGVSRGVFSHHLQELAAAGWLSMNYSSLALLRVQVWVRFCNTYRQVRLGPNKPDLKQVLSMMLEEQANAQAA
jgi:CRP-like cAMP-binding protein